MESESPKRILRDLALIYIALAHGTDQNLDDTEMDIISRRLQDVQAGVSQGTTRMYSCCSELAAASIPARGPW